MVVNMLSGGSKIVEMHKKFFGGPPFEVKYFPGAPLFQPRPPLAIISDRSLIGIGRSITQYVHLDKTLDSFKKCVTVT